MPRFELGQPVKCKIDGLTFAGEVIGLSYWIDGTIEVAVALIESGIDITRPGGFRKDTKGELYPFYWFTEGELKEIPHPSFR